MFYVIDRFEGLYAVCEGSNGEMINILKSELPDGIKEGDKVEKKDDGYIKVDNSSDRERIKGKLNSLFK